MSAFEYNALIFKEKLNVWQVGTAIAFKYKRGKDHERSIHTAMAMQLGGKTYGAVHFVGNWGDTGGTMMLEQDNSHKIRCFICGRRVELDDIVVMSFNDDDMVCVCKNHVKFRYPEGTFDRQPMTAVVGSA